VIHHPVLQRSTTGWSCHSLPLLGFLVGAECIVCDHDITDKLGKCSSSVECHALLQLGGETDHEAVLFFIHVHLVQRIICQIIEFLRVVVHEPSSLLEVHELLVLLPHHASGDVVGVESIAELSP
jgi:hypothetical protein